MSWEGVKGASEHRTTGARAWCFQDGEWCYPDPTMHCPCCMEASADFKTCPCCEGIGYVPSEPDPNPFQIHTRRYQGVTVSCDGCDSTRDERGIFPHAETCRWVAQIREAVSKP